MGRLQFIATVLAVLLAQSAGAVRAQGLPLSSSNRWGSLQFLGPDTIADIADSIAPAVVKIDVSVAPLAGDVRRKNDRRGTDRRYRTESQLPEAKGTGSGVIIKPDGLILTSNHLVDGAERINVTLQDGRTMQAELLGKDVFSDLAVLKVDAQGLPTITFGLGSRVRPGDWVIAVGNPLGLDHSVTLGIVSALGREQKALNTFGARSGAVKFIQTDAAINPGNSGGPLVNLKGEVIGINTFINGSAQNIGFAIPAELAYDVSEKLVRFHAIPHPYIGVIMKDVDEQARQTAGLPADLNGVMVESVAPRSPAFMAGMMPQDFIVAVDDRPVKRSDDVSDAVRRHGIGDKINLKVKRGAQDKTIRVQIEQLPDEPGSP